MKFSIVDFTYSGNMEKLRRFEEGKYLDPNEFGQPGADVVEEDLDFDNKSEAKAYLHEHYATYVEEFADGRGQIHEFTLYEDGEDGSWNIEDSDWE